MRAAPAASRKIHLEPLRIAVVTVIPTPYRDPFWRVFERNEEVELTVFYCAGGKKDRPWTVDWGQPNHACYLKGYNLAAAFGAATSLYWNPEIRKRLREKPYDGIIVAGYNHFTMLWAMWFARRKGIPYFLSSESYLQQRRSWWKPLIKDWLVRRIVSHARGNLPTGKLASEYLLHYGAHPERLCPVPNIPDVDQFQECAKTLLPQRVRLRKERGLEKPSILFVGRFIPMKGGHLLIKAFSRLTRDLDAQLIMLGDGPERTAWQKLATSEGINDRIQFPGFVSPQSIPAWFASVDLMCLPSTNETWSVVVLEALASGLPVVITDRVGCYPNVISRAEVGEVVAAGEIGALYLGLKCQLEKEISRKEMFRLWKETRREFEYGVVASRLRGFLQQWCRFPE